MIVTGWAPIDRDVPGASLVYPTVTTNPKAVSAPIGLRHPLFSGFVSGSPKNKKSTHVILIS
jgi:hypothetical protein